jgi:hypothetical protein
LQPPSDFYILTHLIIDKTEINIGRRPFIRFRVINTGDKYINSLIVRITYMSESGEVFDFDKILITLSKPLAPNRGQKIKRRLKYWPDKKYEKNYRVEIVEYNQY